MSDWKNVQYKDGKFQTSTGGGGGGSSTLAGLDDVNLTNIQNGQILKYDSESNKFVNSDILVSGITCVFRGDIPANSYVDVAVNEGTYLFLPKSTSVHGIIAVFYDSESGGTVSTDTLASGKNMNIFSFSKPQNGYIRISLNNQWARPVVLYKLI